MARLSGLYRRTARSSEYRRIRNAFTLFITFSVAILTLFSFLAGSNAFASLGPWRPTMLFCFALVFAGLSYKGADTAMFGAYVTAYFVSTLSRSASTAHGKPREEVWGLQPYLRQQRGKALATSAAALLCGAASLLAYVAFLILGSCELARIFDWQLAPSVVGLVVAVLTLIVAVPAALGSISAMRTYFASRPASTDQKIRLGDAPPSD